MTLFRRKPRFSKSDVALLEDERDLHPGSGSDYACFTLPNGECVTPNCPLHDMQPLPPEDVCHYAPPRTFPWNVTNDGDFDSAHVPQYTNHTPTKGHRSA